MKIEKFTDENPSPSHQIDIDAWVIIATKVMMEIAGLLPLPI
ncbi:hypothetical protein B6N60_01894 [Richelia sinica FACHB-800]|uniref:Uncharacterized protein n=1 Tax=Richelia sinica FACHB-800 TaxID=1357546 RepID=A0A975Y4I2_9NOST|nr:hypothetical protein [Richelia sinica]QXE23205.1 hypothetical protein B6N60_01894 [Richelia sinica FACHB-800]